MFKYLRNSCRTRTRLCLALCLGAGLVVLVFSSFRRTAPYAAVPAGSSLAQATRSQKTGNKEGAGPTNVPRPIVGEAARAYLQQPGEGQSLMQAITTARFGLKSQERGPFGETGGGYLAASHVQNLIAWFAADGVTVRPTVAETEREHAWHMELRLKAYGYGNDLVAAPPIVSHQVTGNRIEYQRAADFGMRISGFELRNANFEVPNGGLFNPRSEIRNPQFVEWYENRAEGIEQGFTLATRPERNIAVDADEPLRLLLSLNGDLTAQVKRAGQAIELTDSRGKPALSYSKLTASDAGGKQLPAQLEASADGKEIALVVDDRGASYPIVIDPITASLEKILDGGVFHQSGAQFGDAVAIDGGNAIVGAWLEDSPWLNNGAVYMFSRTGSSWNFVAMRAGVGNNVECGYSVAIKGDNAAYGCPGANSNAGRAFVFQFSGSSNNLREILPDVGDPAAGDFFGASIAISDIYTVVGAPFSDANVGRFYLFSTPTGSLLGIGQGRVDNNQAGTGVATEGVTVVVGTNLGRADVWTVNSGGLIYNGDVLRASDGAPSDLFGQSVALSGNTAVVSAPGNDEKGIDAGAAYVFVRNASGQWTQQQKLTASDGKANDIFSYYSVAIQGNTIVVGARRQDLSSSNPNDNSGAAYIFTRNGTVWTQQTKLSAGGFYRAPGDEFGTSVGISRDTVIVSAPHEAATDGTANSGVTYVYRLSCVPPYASEAESFTQNDLLRPDRTVCPGERVFLGVLTANPTNAALSYRWRKNGVDIPGATSPGYTIDSASASVAGNYDCFVSNSCGGEISSPATLGVHSYNINPASQNFGASGSTGIVNVTSTGSCAWTAVSNSPFISVTSGASGSGNGTVNFTVAANSNAAQRTGSITIAGKTFSVTQDGAGVLVSNVQFSASSYSAGEGSNNATITVTRTGDTSGAVTVDFATSDIVAQQRTDYTIAAGTLTFAAGETSKTFDVLLVDDNYVEGSETLNLTLSNPTGGAVLGAPSSATLTITDNDTISPTTNPLDNADQQFFVRQHYYDFLSRLPDPGGFGFWVGQITQCGSNQSCVKSKRLDVSNAFFFELEYQQTGAYVFRLYRAAFGNIQPFPNGDNSNQTEARKLPSYAVFARDRARVVGGANLSQGQSDLANAFVNRAEFLAKYPASQDGPSFVDAITATIRNDTGADLASQRTALISLFNSGGRGAVLYRLADDNLPTNPINNRLFIDAEYNRAFVATQYFGYLRRDPDIGGFLFWLGQVNNGPLRDSTKQHAMVCSFITAAEYQQRFSAVVTHSNAECQ